MLVTVPVVRQQLANLASSGGSHKDQAEKYNFVYILHNQFTADHYLDYFLNISFITDTGQY